MPLDLPDRNHYTALENIAAFDVIDKTTGLKPNLRKIALEEEWAKNLMYCDMDGFMFDQDGSLYLVDDCNTLASCPEGRFEVKWKNLTPENDFVIASSMASARIYLQIRSCTYRSTLEGARKLLAELKATGDPDYQNAKIYQRVTGAVEVE